MHLNGHMMLLCPHFKMDAQPAEDDNFNDSYKAQVEEAITFILRIEAPTTSIPITIYNVGKVKLTE